MADTEDLVNDGNAHAWFKMFDRSFDDRIGALIKSKLIIRLKEIEEICEKASSNIAKVMIKASGAKDISGKAQVK